MTFAMTPLPSMSNNREDPCPSRRRWGSPPRAAIATLAVLSALALASSAASVASRAARRALSEALPDGGCFVTPAVAAPPEIRPVMAASYPGSGARMTWNLVEALTGVVTGDDWNSNGWGRRVVSVKTHWPHPHGHRLDWEDEVDRAFVVVRNPLKAIPSFHNFLYEFTNHLENHSTRAPVNEWIRWRDKSLMKELGEWRDHAEYYLSRYPIDKRLFLTYESLTDDDEEVGGGAAGDLTKFLGQGPGVDPIAEESVTCVWGTVVKYNSAKKYNTRKRLDPTVEYVGSYPIWPSSNRRGDKERPYTRDQIDTAVFMLREIEVKYRNVDPRVRDIMRGYIKECEGMAADDRTAADVPAAEDDIPPPPQQVDTAGHAPRQDVHIAGVEARVSQPRAWNSAGKKGAAAGEEAEVEAKQDMETETKTNNLAVSGL